MKNFIEANSIIPLKKRAMSDNDIDQETLIGTLYETVSVRYLTLSAGDASFNAFWRSGIPETHSLQQFGSEERKLKNRKRRPKKSILFFSEQKPADLHKFSGEVVSNSLTILSH